MTALLAALDSPFVAEPMGERIQQRRARLGMSVRELATRAGVDRGRLAALEKGEGQARATTIALVETALDQLEAEMGYDETDRLVSPEEESVVEFRVTGNFGVDVVVRGPVRDMAALEDSVGRLIARMSTNRPEATEGP